MWLSVGIRIGISEDGSPIKPLAEAAMADLQPGMLSMSAFGGSEHYAGDSHRCVRVVHEGMEIRSSRLGSLLLFYPFVRRDLGR